MVAEEDSGAEGEIDMKVGVDGTLGIQGTGIGTGKGIEIGTGAIKVGDNG